MGLKMMTEHKPDVVVLAAATVGGIGQPQPSSGFLLDNLQIETHVINAAWQAGVRNYFWQQLHLSEVRRAAHSEDHRLPVLWSPPMPGMPLPKSLESSSAKRFYSTASMQSA